LIAEFLCASAKGSSHKGRSQAPRRYFLILTHVGGRTAGRRGQPRYLYVLGNAP
jgi:hypothetical protein